LELKATTHKERQTDEEASDLASGRGRPGRNLRAPGAMKTIAHHYDDDGDDDDVV